MAKTKNSKPKKDSVFDAEDFDVQDDAGQDDLLPEEEEDMPDEPPEDMIEEEELLSEEPIELIDPASVAEEIDIIDTPDNVVSLDHLEEEKEHEDAEAADMNGDDTKSVVIKCPHCLEEVLDMEICPLCGNRLRASSSDQIGEREDGENILDEYADFSDEAQDYPRKSVRGMEDPDVDLFGGLPYQDQYSPISSDSI